MKYKYEIGTKRGKVWDKPVKNMKDWDSIGICLGQTSKKLEPLGNVWDKYRFWYIHWDYIENKFVPMLEPNIVPNCEIPNLSQIQTQHCPELTHMHVPNLPQTCNVSWDVKQVQ